LPRNRPSANHPDRAIKKNANIKSLFPYQYFAESGTGRAAGLLRSSLGAGLQRDWDVQS
jgi:hypothetical protein